MTTVWPKKAIRSTRILTARWACFALLGLMLPIPSCKKPPSEPSDSKAPASASATPPTTQPTDDNAATLVEQRPYALVDPPGAPKDQALPLVLYLHGYGDTGRSFARSLGVSQLAAKHRFVAAVPDGTPDSKGRRFWNATEGCCNFEDRPVDDVRYLTAVIDDAIAKRNIDRSRVFVVGFSNGGFMAHRLGCELGERLAGIVSMAGAGPSNPSTCQPEGTLAVLQIHGDADRAVPYQGGRTLGRPDSEAHPPVQQTMKMWAARNRCRSEPTQGSPMDLDPALPGDETLVARWEGCEADGAVELWTVRGAGHFVGQSASAASAMWKSLTSR
ncbi:MAG: alpha/beta hydrolase family esterase [Myxococcota bacterium]